MNKEGRQHWFLSSLFNSYSQIFFSDNRIFASILLVVTLLDPYTGFYGLFGVLSTNLIARGMGFDRHRIARGLYGFNALLVALGLGVYFEPGWLLLIIVLLSGILTLFLSVALEGIIGKYALPYLSLPFVLAFWAISLASREFSGLGISERGIYLINDLYALGGQRLVDLYNWWLAIDLPSFISAYFLSLSAIFFQNNIIAGMLIAAGLLIYSRIAFSLSLLGFYMAFLFYQLIGADFAAIHYSYVGFNYILTAIAVGGYFIVPHRSSYLWTTLLIPLVAIITISMNAVFTVFYLPIYSLPFNIITLLFLYILKFREDDRIRLNTLFVQQNSPEQNLYAVAAYKHRFGKQSPIPVYLPFIGAWTVTQGHRGKLTHEGPWQHAWDFEIRDEEGKTFKNAGDFPADYYCYEKPVTAAADGIVEEVTDDIHENIVGERNLEDNWGNSVVIRHTEFLFTQVSHLKAGSIPVKPGDKVRKGDRIGRCGNSGNSPVPHLHFQMQATPHLGSVTLDYPVSDYLRHARGLLEIKNDSIPRDGETICNIVADTSIKKALSFIPGEKIKFSVKGMPDAEANWEVKRDWYLNRYIECSKTGGRAYFRTSDTTLYFTHFEGSKRSLLYFFMLACYRVCLGSYPKLTVTDRYPLNLVFTSPQLVIQDILAPFFLYKRGDFSLSYLNDGDSLSSGCVYLKSHITRSRFGKAAPAVEFSIRIEHGEIRNFTVQSPNKNIEAKCIKGS